MIKLNSISILFVIGNNSSIVMIYYLLVNLFLFWFLGFKVLKEFFSFSGGV